jgi:[ribosomal protein S5]-alanine N-acetyltransferase
MEYLPAVLRPEETDQMMERLEQHFHQHGFGLFAAELRETQTFIGYIGFTIPSFQALFLPAVEIGWR